MKIEWQKPERIVPLGPAEVQVWSLDLARIDRSSLPGRVPELLPECEITRMGRMRSVSGREEFAAGRILLRMLLAHHLGIGCREVVLELDPFQKPRLRKPAGLEFNLSHSRGVLLAALSRGGPVGVDVEWINRRFAGSEELVQMARENLAPAEYRYLAGLPDPAARLRAFHAAWTRKESLLKAEGRGLGEPVEAGWTVTLESDGGMAVRMTKDGEERFRLQTFFVTEEHVASVASVSSRDTPRFFDSSSLFDSPAS